MQEFNVANLKKAVSLSMLTKTDINLSKITVKNVTYSGDTYPEGVIPLNARADHAVDLKMINRLNDLLNMIWPHQILIQVGVRNRMPVLFVYQETRR